MLKLQCWRTVVSTLTINKVDNQCWSFNVEGPLFQCCINIKSTLNQQCVACYVMAKQHYVTMACVCVCMCVCLCMCVLWYSNATPQFVVAEGHNYMKSNIYSHYVTMASMCVCVCECGYVYHSLLWQKAKIIGSLIYIV